MTWSGSEMGKFERASAMKIIDGVTLPHASALKKAGMVRPVVLPPNQYVADKPRLHNESHTAPALPLSVKPEGDVGSTPSTATSVVDGTVADC